MKYWYYDGGEDKNHCQVWYVAQQESQSNLLKKMMTMMVLTMGMLMMMVMGMKMVVVMMMVTNHGHSSHCESQPSRSLAVILSVDRSNRVQRPSAIPQLNIMRRNKLYGLLHNMVGLTNL